MLKNLIFRDFLSCLSNVKMDRYLYWEIMRQVTICETTAFFMQYLARLASSANEGFYVISIALTFLAPKYGKTRFDFAAYSLSNIASPHQQVSYYLISNQ